MAVESTVLTFGALSASADLSAKQFRFVKMSAAGTVTVTAAITDRLIGVLQDAPTSGQPASVGFGGVTKVIAGGTIAAGDQLGSDNQGRAVTIVNGTDTTQYRGGIARSAGAVGDTIDMLLQVGGRAA